MQDYLTSPYNTVAALSTAVSSFDEDILKNLQQCKRGLEYSLRRACLDFSEDHQTHTQELHFSASQCTHTQLPLSSTSLSVTSILLMYLSPTLLTAPGSVLPPSCSSSPASSGQYAEQWRDRQTADLTRAVSKEDENYICIPPTLLHYKEPTGWCCLHLTSFDPNSPCKGCSVDLWSVECKGFLTNMMLFITLGEIKTPK